MSDFDSVKSILNKFDAREDRYITREFQKYAYDLAEELGDLEHKSLYMRLAKTVPRQLLEQARYFVRDAGGVKSPAKLFMWKLAQLRKEHKERKSEARSTKSETNSND